MLIDFENWRSFINKNLMSDEFLFYNIECNPNENSNNNFVWPEKISQNLINAWILRRQSLNPPNTLHNSKIDIY